MTTTNKDTGENETVTSYELLDCKVLVALMHNNS